MLSAHYVVDLYWQVFLVLLCCSIVPPVFSCSVIPWYSDCSAVLLHTALDFLRQRRLYFSNLKVTFFRFQFCQTIVFFLALSFHNELNENTRGVNVPWSICMILSSYARFFSFSFITWHCCGNL